jgi:transposase
MTIGARPWAPNRAYFEGILWILQTGAAWRFLPDEFPSPATCLPFRIVRNRIFIICHFF